MSRRRPTLIASVALVIGALLSSVVAAPAAAVPLEYTGTTTGPGSWPDVTIAAPITVGEYYESSFTYPYNGRTVEGIAASGLPDGLDYVLDTPTGVVTISGTPTGLDGLAVSMWFEAWASEDTWRITFSSIQLDPGLPATSTVATAPVVAPFSAIPVSGTVTGASPTGTVALSVAGSSAPATLTNGSGSRVAFIDPEFIGSYVDTIATYSGDEGNAPSTSAAASTYIYGSDRVSGVVSVEGDPIVGATVSLLDGDLAVVATAVTSASGRYRFTLTSIDTVAKATATYYIRAVRNGEDGFYATGGTSSTPAFATRTGPTQWFSDADQDIEFAGVAPTWPTTTIGDMQVGTAFSQVLTANGDATITYSLHDDLLPAGITFNAATGTLSGTPTYDGPWSATIRATNDYGFDDLLISGTVAAKPELGLELNFVAGTKVGDATTEIGASGLQVGSTYTLYMFSTPVLLYTGTIDATGAFLHTVTLPAGTPVGAHELELTGVAPDGTVMTARAWFTLLADGTIGAISYAGPLQFTLVSAGVEPFAPLVAALLLTAVGVYLVARRRRLA